MTLKRHFLCPIISAYELRCFWWEMFECVRKLSLVGLPVFFNPGSSEQLMFGLLVCFLSTAFFAYYKPYRDQTDDYVLLVCLIEVFVALLAAVALQYGIGEFTEEAIGPILISLLFIPIVLVCLHIMPMSRAPVAVYSLTTSMIRRWSIMSALHPSCLRQWTRVG